MWLPWSILEEKAILPSTFLVLQIVLNRGSTFSLRVYEVIILGSLGMVFG